MSSNERPACGRGEAASEALVFSDRVSDLRAWARSRIDQCRAQERKFGVYNGKRLPQALIEAWTERLTLQAVLRILNGENGEETLDQKDDA